MDVVRTFVAIILCSDLSKIDVHLRKMTTLETGKLHEKLNKRQIKRCVRERRGVEREGEPYLIQTFTATFHFARRETSISSRLNR